MAGGAQVMWLNGMIDLRPAGKGTVRTASFARSALSINVEMIGSLTCSKSLGSVFPMKSGMKSLGNQRYVKFWGRKQPDNRAGRVGLIRA